MRSALKPVIALTVVLALALAPSPALASTRCGRVSVQGYHGRAKVRVVQGRASCSTARTLIRAAFRAFITRRSNSTSPTWGLVWNVRGWSCSHGLGGSQAFCRRGHRRIDGSFRHDDGWSF